MNTSYLNQGWIITSLPSKRLSSTMDKYQLTDTDKWRHCPNNYRDLSGRLKCGRSEHLWGVNKKLYIFKNSHRFKSTEYTISSGQCWNNTSTEFLVNHAFNAKNILNVITQMTISAVFWRVLNCQPIVSMKHKPILKRLDIRAINENIVSEATILWLYKSVENKNQCSEDKCSQLSIFELC